MPEDVVELRVSMARRRILQPHIDE
jgi:hypothetical protein